MEKQDILVVVIAILCFSVLAVVVKPVLTAQYAGHPPGDGLTPVPTITQRIPLTPTTVPTGQGTAPTITGTPRPTWDRTVRQVNFTNLDGGQAQLTPNPTIPPDVAPNRTLITYAQITNQWSGTTESLYIPAPYWVLEYKAVPVALPPDVFPRLIIQVFDVRDPNREVRVINQDIYEEPDDPWTEKFYEGNREYYFRISTRFLKSYTLTIKVPVQYA